MADERQGTHWQGCWRAHHECAVHLLDLILREDTVGEDEARRLLADAKAKVWAEDCEEFGCSYEDPQVGGLVGHTQECLLAKGSPCICGWAAHSSRYVAPSGPEVS